MIEFIKESLKTKELYMDADTFNKIVEDFKKEIISNKDTFFSISNIDTSKCGQITNLDNILKLLESYKNEDIIKRREKEVILVSYYGNPYITINLCMQSLLKKRITVSVIEDNMIGINKFLISIFNHVLEKYKINKIINLFNLVDIAEVRNVKNYVNNVVCVGNTNTYYKYKKYGIEKLKFVPFKNMVIYCDEKEYLKLKLSLYEYAILNGIETEIYEEDIDEFIECINLDDKLENIVILSKAKETIENVENRIKNHKIYINKNPFKNEEFKIENM